jgi:hypothetical protein
MSSPSKLVSAFCRRPAACRQAHSPSRERVLELEYDASGVILILGTIFVKWLYKSLSKFSDLHFNQWPS